MNLFLKDDLKSKKKKKKAVSSSFKNFYNASTSTESKRKVN